MRAVLAQSNDLDEALESFGKEDQKKTPWTPEEKRKDHSKRQLKEENDTVEVHGRRLTVGEAETNAYALMPVSHHNVYTSDDDWFYFSLSGTDVHARNSAALLPNVQVPDTAMALSEFSSRGHGRDRRPAGDEVPRARSSMARPTGKPGRFDPSAANL
nr:unnamed protein product [Digitaria exilis]